MSSLRAKIIDRNRYSKKYPCIRAPKRTTYIGTSDMAIEMGSLYFDNQDTGTLNFDAPFNDTNYQVVAVSRDVGVDSADVNVYISAKTVSYVIVQASSNFTGYVDVFAVRIS